MKIEAITGGRISNITMYPWGDDSLSQRRMNNKVVKITKANWRDDPESCVQTFIEALRSLPAGFYTFVHESGYVQDIRVGKRGGYTVRPYDRRTINNMQQLPCLRIEVER